MRRSRAMARILVVDDEASIRTTIEIVLAREGFDVVLAGNGAAGVAALESASFDAIIVDVFMPGMDGRASIRRFRKLAPAIPIVVMSGVSFRDTRDPPPDF